MGYHLTLPAIIARKRAIWSRTVKNSRRRKRKMPKKANPTQKKVYPECGTCGKKNHSEERSWQGAGAHLKPKRTRRDDSSDNNPDSKVQIPHYNSVSSGYGSTSKKDDQKN